MKLQGLEALYQQAQRLVEKSRWEPLGHELSVMLWTLIRKIGEVERARGFDEKQRQQQGPN